ITYRNPKRTNWTLFHNEIASRLNEIPKKITNTHELETATTVFTNIMQQSFLNSCPEKAERPLNQPIWWNKELSILKKKLRKQFNMSKRRNKWEKYITLLKTFNKTLRKTKNDAWRAHCKEIENISQSARLHRALKHNQLNPIGTISTGKTAHT